MYLFIICRNALAKLWCLSSSVMHTPTGAYVAIVVVLFIAVCWLSCNIYCNGKAGETHATILPFELLWWLNNLVANLYCASLCMSILVSLNSALHDARTWCYLHTTARAWSENGCFSSAAADDLCVDGSFFFVFFCLRGNTFTKIKTKTKFYFIYLSLRLGHGPS
jgi:hypothetical protein